MTDRALDVAFVLVGDELLEGHRADSNGPWLAARITALGGRVRRIVFASDEPSDIAAAISGAAADARVVLVSGGLGPTEDDRTRQGLAEAAGRPLVVQDDAVRDIAATLAARGIESQPGHHEQGAVPEGGRWLPNPEGVAPGVVTEVGGATVYAMPGVPVELHAMFDQIVAPELLERDVEPAVEVSVWAAGITEPQVEDRVGLALTAYPVRVGYYPHEGELEVRLFARGDGAAAAVGTARGAALELLGADGFEPPAGGRIEHVVVAGLEARGESVATAESITGGLIARMLTRVPGASRVFPVGWVTYASETKTAQLGVPSALIEEHGVVSGDVAAAMAEGARREAGADFGLATTGVAGPGALVEPGREPVPHGRAFAALATGEETVVRRLDAPLAREGVQRRAAVAALDLLRRHLR